MNILRKALKILQFKYESRTFVSAFRMDFSFVANSCYFDKIKVTNSLSLYCLLYTSDAADD